jgi:hypothetical protein
MSEQIYVATALRAGQNPQLRPLTIRQMWSRNSA